MAERSVIVVGAGPAGVRCAEALVEARLAPIVIDEGRRDGGQIYRRQPEAFRRTYAMLYGTEADKAQALHRAFDELRAKVDYRPETLAWNIADGQLHVVAGTRTSALRYDALVICSGATDRVMPLEGWNLAGCYSLGGAQIALKSQACAIGRRVAFVGTGPLLYLVASQYVKVGAGVAAVLDTSRYSLRLRALPALASQPGGLWKGVALSGALRRGGVPVMSGVTPLRVLGSAGSGVAGVVALDERGNEVTFACDAVALGYHLRPETQLADLARCEFDFDAQTRQWLPRIDADGRSSVSGIYLAGDGARVLGADAAEASGRLAALAALRDLGYAVADAQFATLRRSLARMARFQRGLAQAFPWPRALAAELPDDAVVCRCEAITAGELRRGARDLGASEVNRAKAFSRVGMGRCQGRYCGHAAAEVVADAAQVPIVQVGRLRTQAPVKPLPISTVAAEATG
jgi:NADPH-dependent 2,4-dienoyl-CoA reductase/sulfur reductase-like enzyme